MYAERLIGYLSQETNDEHAPDRAAKSLATRGRSNTDESSKLIDYMNVFT